MKQKFPHPQNKNEQYEWLFIEIFDMYSYDCFQGNARSRSNSADVSEPNSPSKRAS